MGLGVEDGREEFTGVPFRALANLGEVAELDGPVIFVNEAHEVQTRAPAYLILHNPPPIRDRHHAFATAGTRDKILIATSRYAAALWADYLDVDVDTVQVIYPFAEPEFAAQSRTPRPPGRTRVLYAGRLSAEKVVYSLLEMLHLDVIEEDADLTFTATSAGSDKPQGAIIERLLDTHPGISVVPACRTPASMAALMADHDVVVMPSNSQYWHETFGIVSVEAQHTGCRVVASDDGGLPETDCGGLVLVEPDNAEALAAGVRQAIAAGPLAREARQRASTRFTVAQSVQDLLDRLARPAPLTPAKRRPGARAAHPARLCSDRRWCGRGSSGSRPSPHDPAVVRPTGRTKGRGPAGIVEPAARARPLARVAGQDEAWSTLELPLIRVVSYGSQAPPGVALQA